MLQIEVFDQHAREYDEWYEQFPAVFQSEVLAIREQLSKLPENITGIEVGLGTGRFANALGIKEGVEPAENMRAMAVKRGIEVMDARAESLPYKDVHFDFVLFVTISHLDKLPEALKEAHRVLKKGGSIFIGLIREDSPIGQAYQERRKNSTFYSQATFYRVPRVTEMLSDIGFKKFEYIQTLFDQPEDINKVQMPREGWEEGSFVVIKAVKK
jgi:ubiquinone/menaquinone biosynthesis C-methylase UbiE